MSSNSTTVRFMFGLGLKLAPGRTRALAARLFLRPRRSKKRLVPVLPNGQEGLRGSVRVEGRHVTFWSWGEGPVILLVHGWEGRAAQFTKFVEPIVQSGFRAVAMDLPAHGLSDGEEVHLVKAAASVRAVSTAVGPVKVVIAHSFGGAATLLAQIESPIAERIVGISPSAEPKIFVDRAADFMGLAGKHREDLYRRIQENVGRTFEQVDLRRMPGTLDTPILVLHDPEDAEVPFAHGQAVAAVSRRGEIEAIRGVGHRAILKDRAAISRAIEFATGRPRPLDLPAVLDAPPRGLRWENRSGSA